MVTALPTIVNGERVPSSDAVPVELSCPSGASVQIGALTSDLTRRVLDSDRQPLSELGFQDVVAFLNRVGRFWRSRDFPRRRIYTRQLQQYLGYSERAANVEADLIGVLLTGHVRMHDTVGAELGSRHILDEWVRREECFVRAFPRGRSVHILAGNVPVSGVLSVVRALITKNVCIAKPASEDPFTPISLALSFMDVDPEHPVSRAMSVIYWPHDSRLGADIVESADAVCAWGGGPAIEWAHRHTSASATFVPFGPRRSIAIVAEGADVERAAIGVAHDVAFYDQRACFSTQDVYVVGDPKPFALALETALDRYEELLPKGSESDDAVAGRRLGVLEEEFLGGTVVENDPCQWTVILGRDPSRVYHPLGRTVYIHRVESVEHVTEHVDSSVQTVQAEPWEALHRVRDAMALRGVSRFTELGSANVFRVGGTHDDVYPLSYLVRIASVEGPTANFGKGMVLPFDQTDILENHGFAAA